MTGYHHAQYAESLMEFGTPRKLPRSGGWILERRIPGFQYRDAMGCYPLFACQAWSHLNEDLEELEKKLVSISIVADPFGDYEVAYLHQCFDVVIPFKSHFIVDTSQPINEIVTKHHRKYSRKALEVLYVERCSEPIKFLDEWVKLYETLIKKHNIKGIRAFSRLSFAKQLVVPGIVMFRARCKGITVGMRLWYVQGNIGYSHLSAFSHLGYDLRASYALNWFSMCYFTDKVRYLNLGGGTKSDGTDGLSHFKRGWSSGTRIAYLCGRIFDHESYDELVAAKGISHTEYFPAYRKGEFT